MPNRPKVLLIYYYYRKITAILPKVKTSTTSHSHPNPSIRSINSLTLTQALAATTNEVQAVQQINKEPFISPLPILNT
jgi:hypothetical protein